MAARVSVVPSPQLTNDSTGMLKETLWETFESIKLRLGTNFFKILWIPSDIYPLARAAEKNTACRGRRNSTKNHFFLASSKKGTCRLESEKIWKTSPNFWNSGCDVKWSDVKPPDVKIIDWVLGHLKLCSLNFRFCHTFLSLFSGLFFLLLFGFVVFPSCSFSFSCFLSVTFPFRCCFPFSYLSLLFRFAFCCFVCSHAMQVSGTRICKTSFDSKC